MKRYLRIKRDVLTVGFALFFHSCLSGPDYVIVECLLKTDTDHVLVGTTDGLYYADKDGVKCEKILDKRIVSLVKLSNGKLLASSIDGIFTSENGRRWEINNSFPDSIYDETSLGIDIILVTSLCDRIFAGTSKGVLLSSNEGDTWQLSNLGNERIKVLSANSNGHIFASTWESNIFRSLDNGASWENISDHLPQDLYIISLAVGQGGHVVAGTLNNYVYCSADSGATWLQVRYGLPGKQVDAVAFGENNRVFAASNLNIYYSKEFLGNWYGIVPEVDDVVNFFEFYEIGIYYAGALSSGVYVSKDTGKTWTKFLNASDLIYE